MRIIFSALLAFMLASPFAFASVGLNMNGKDSGAVGDINIINTSSATTTWSDGFTVSIPILDPNLFGTGMGNGSAVSQVSTAVAVSTSAAYIRKVLVTNSDALFTAGTMANGKPGQQLTIFAAGGSPGNGTTGNNYTITPTTKTGFVSVKLTATNDFVTFLYVDDTVGWVIVAYGGTITINK